MTINLRLVFDQNKSTILYGKIKHYINFINLCQLFLVKTESWSILYLINNLVCKENMSNWIYVYIEVTCEYNQTTNDSILRWCKSLSKLEE